MEVGSGERLSETERRGKQRSATAWMEPARWCECKRRQHPIADQEERTEMLEIDRKLDAIAAKLRRSGIGD